MRRLGFALYGLAALSLVIFVVSVGYALSGPEQRRTLAWGYAIVNLGFAVVNGLLGFGLLMLSRPSRS
jgi:hypothetical protein